MRMLARQRGISLIEVLVAIVIFSVGVLGIALMQIKSMQFSKQSSARTTAILQARSLADAMRANPAGVYGVSDAAGIAAKQGDLSTSYYAYSGSVIPDSSSCGASNQPCLQAKRDLTHWIEQLQAGTAAPVAASGGGSTTPVWAKVSVNSAGTGALTIISSWNGMSPDKNGVSTNESYQFDFQP